MDFERHSTDLSTGDDVIHALAGSPSVLNPGTPGMLTPKELVGEPGSSAGGGSGGGGGLEAEVNPFGEFSSVTRDVGDW